MKARHLPRDRRRDEVRHVYWRINPDRVQSDEVYTCNECGHEFRDPPYDFDICPVCGADFWPVEE
jgi:rubrerythrin